MKQLTRQNVKYYESAFDSGHTVLYFGRAEHDKFPDCTWYNWIPIKHKKDIKKCVLNNIELIIGWVK